jgi:DNA repair exonuclease SbcCD nuclease subunit
MKAIITSDLHVRKGIFVDIAIEYLLYLQEYYKKQKIDFIFFAGDIFEKSNRINNEAFLPLFKQLHEMKEDGIEMIFLLGNHDIYNLNNDSLVEAFLPFGQVIKDTGMITIDNKKIQLLAYTKDKSAVPQEGDYLITHLDILDFKFDNDYAVQDPSYFTPDQFKHFRTVFSGHYHKFQNKKNIVYQGGPYQLSFGEAGTEKGFVEFDIENDNWEFIKYTKAPEFIKIPIEQFNEIDVENKFVSVEITKKTENFVKLKHILFSKGAIDVVPKYKTEEITMESGKVELDFSASTKNMIIEYIKKVEIKDIDNKKLLETFEKVAVEL